MFNILHLDLNKINNDMKKFIDVEKDMKTVGQIMYDCLNFIEDAYEKDKTIVFDDEELLYKLFLSVVILDRVITIDNIWNFEFFVKNSLFLLHYFNKKIEEFEKKDPKVKQKLSVFTVKRDYQFFVKYNDKLEKYILKKLYLYFEKVSKLIREFHNKYCS